jgi:hypothetical protein
MESLSLKGFKLFIFLLIIAGCSPERNNPFDPMTEELAWINIYRPEAITILPDGNLCVANRERFTIFTPEGDSIACFYPAGGVNGLDVGFGRIISVYGSGMRVFALDGTYETGIGLYEYNSQLYDFSNLTGIYADENYLYLVDSAVVIKIDSSFECLARWESSEDKALYDIFYSKGYLYATLKNSIGIQVFDTSGNFIKEENLQAGYWGDEYLSRGITGDNTGNVFFFAYSRYFSSLDSTYHISDSWICAVKEINYEGTSWKFSQERDLLDIVYYDGYLYVTKYWGNNVRKLWLDGYIP